MERFWQICKEHPLWVGGGVLFLVILFVLIGSKGKAAASQSAGIYDITQDPNVVAANAQEAIAQNSNNAAIAVAQIQADAANQQTAAEEALGTASIAAQSKAYSDYFTAQADETQQAYGAAVTINGQNTASATEIAQTQETGAVSMANTAAATAITLANGTNQTNLSLANIGLQKTQLGEMGSLAKGFFGSSNNALNDYYNTIQADGGDDYTPGPYPPIGMGTGGHNNASAEGAAGGENSTLFGQVIQGILNFGKGTSSVTQTQTGPNGTTTQSTVVQTGKA